MTEAHAQPEVETIELMGVSTLAKHFGVTPHTVNQWMWRARRGEYPPTPKANFEIPSTAPNQVFAGWYPERLPEWEAWRDQLPGQDWRKGQTGNTKYTTHEHVGVPRHRGKADQ